VILASKRKPERSRSSSFRLKQRQGRQLREPDLRQRRWSSWPCWRLSKKGSRRSRESPRRPGLRLIGAERSKRRASQRRLDLPRKLALQRRPESRRKPGLLRRQG